ncbi:MAG: hypothetical protein KC431_00650 [Myxococcales bacterium]|nr:hypothetical protein [Myxococcales bacterium]MCA9695999.1 hypothetical protein [Myxococcales bacterium]
MNRRLQLFRERLLLPLSLCLSLTAAACTSQEGGTPPKADAPSEHDGDGKAEADAQEPAGPKLPDGADLLAGHVAAAGGPEAITKFDSIHAKSSIDTGKQKLMGHSELWWQKDGKFYLEQEIEGVGKSRAGYDGEVIWSEDPITGLRKLEGAEAVSFIQSSLMFPAHSWQDHFSAANTKGKRKLDDGSEAWEIELVSEGGPNVTIGLDVDSKLIRFMKSKQVTSMGDMPYEAFAEDYRDVEGYKFAMKKRSSITGLLELEEVTDTFEVNVEIDPGKFAFPSTREVVPADPAEQMPVDAPPTNAETAAKG